MAPKKQLSGQNNPSKAKRDRKVLSLVEKTKILDLLQSGMSLAEVGRKVGKNESSIRTIKQKEAEIRGSVSAAPTTAKMVSLVRDKVLAKTEKALSVWLEDMSQKQIPVDGKIMREKALRLYEHCCEGVEESERKRFKASKGWLASYVKRYSLKNLKITGESASPGGEAFSDVIQDDVEEHVEEHRETLTNEELEDLLKSSTEILHIGAVGTMQQSSSSSSSSYEGYQERRTRVVMASHEALRFIKQEKEDTPSPVVPPDPTEKFDDAVADLIIIKVEEDTERPEQLRDIHGRLATGDQNLFKVEQDIGQETEAESAEWTLEKFSEVFRMVQNVKEKIMDYDPTMERSIKFTRLITEAMEPLQRMFDELKMQKEQLPVTMFEKQKVSTVDDLQPSTSSARDATQSSASSSGPPSPASEEDDPDDPSGISPEGQ